MWSHQILCSALLPTSLPRLESLFFLVKGFNNNPGLTQPRTSCLCICYFFFTNDFSLPRMDSYCMVEYKVLVNFSFRNSISISTITQFKDTEIYKRALFSIAEYQEATKETCSSWKWSTHPTGFLYNDAWITLQKYDTWIPSFLCCGNLPETLLLICIKELFTCSCWFKPILVR